MHRLGLLLVLLLMPANAGAAANDGVVVARGWVDFAVVARADRTPARADHEPPLFVPEPAGPAPARARAAESAAPRDDATAASPAPAQSFAGLGDNGTSIPPDTQGAVGPSHLVIALNTQVRMQSRSGTALSTVTLEGFWSGITVQNAFDPRVLYDAIAHRWILVALDGKRAASSAVLLAVTETDDPTGVWFQYRLDADVDDDAWADYPIVGVTKDWVVVSLNMFTISSDAFVESKIFVVDKLNVAAGAPESPTILTDATGRSSLAPVASNDPALDRAYLVTSAGASSGRLAIRTILGPVGSETLSAETIVTSGTTWGFSPTPDADSLPQAGTAVKIDAGDARMQNCAYRSGSIWCAHTIFLTGPARSAVQWWELSPAGSVVQRGRIDDDSGTVMRAYPSIAVNGNGATLIGYSRFSPTTFASAAYSFRAAADPAGTLQDEVVFKGGEAQYTKTLGGSSVRWGDYSATVVDPANDRDLWTLQEYALPPASGQDRWGTWWARVGSPVVAFSASSVDVAESAGAIALTVTREGDTGGESAIAYATAAGSAGDADFTPSSGTVAFAVGESSKVVSIPITQDAVAERPEMFTVTLSAPGSGTRLGTPASVTVRIADDETPVVRFASASASAQESAAAIVLGVERLGDASGTVAVSYATAPGTAGDGDFTAVSDVLTIASGVSDASISIPILNDSAREAAESFSVTLSAPTGATLGDPSVATATILASDQRPDGLVRLSSDARSVGSNVYNTTASGQIRSTTFRRGTSRTFYVTLQNDGNAPARFTVRGSGSSSGFAVRYSAGSASISSAIVGGTYSPGTLAPGASRVIRIVIAAGRSASIGAIKSCLVTITWTGDGIRRDVVKARARVTS